MAAGVYKGTPTLFFSFFMVTDNQLPATTPPSLETQAEGFPRHLHASSCHQPPPSLAFSSGGGFLITRMPFVYHQPLRRSKHERRGLHFNTRRWGSDAARRYPPPRCVVLPVFYLPSPPPHHLRKRAPMLVFDGGSLFSTSTTPPPSKTSEYARFQRWFVVCQHHHPTTFENEHLCSFSTVVGCFPPPPPHHLRK